jgi:peroxiredoxin
MTSTRLRAAATVAALLVAGCRSAPDWMQNGMTAPELSGRTVDGQPVALSAERGKAAAVIFFADWCPHCRALYATERDLARRMASHPFVLIGVDTSNSPEDLRSAIVREGITWPVIRDDGTNAAAWGVTGLPTVYLIDADGVIRDFDVRGNALLDGADALIAEAERRKR